MEIFYDFDTSLKKALSDIEKDYLKYDALVICGTHTPKDWDRQIEKIKEARETGRPFLGICFGHQLACIEYARNILGIKDATSEEFGVKGTFVVKKRKNGLKVGVYDGESYWHNYEPDIIWHAPKNFITTQFHPEYESYPNKHHPLLLKFIKLCKSNGITDGHQQY